MKRLLPALARRHKHKLDALTDIATRALFLCPICVGPIKTPQLYLVDEKPRAILCACCMTAIEKCEFNLFKLRMHRRFDTERRASSGRLARYIALHTEGSFLFPAETTSELVEDQGSGAHRESGDDSEEERVP